MADRGCSTILVVDDCADTTEVVSTLLSMLGHECRAARTGAAALEAAAQLEPDIVLLDLVLPDIPGLLLAERLRRVVKKELYMAAFTGLATAGDRMRVRQAGFDEHLVKPVDGRALRQLIVRAATAKQARARTDPR